MGIDSLAEHRQNVDNIFSNLYKELDSLLIELSTLEQKGENEITTQMIEILAQLGLRTTILDKIAPQHILELYYLRDFDTIKAIVRMLNDINDLIIYNTDRIYIRLEGNKILIGLSKQLNKFAVDTEILYSLKQPYFYEINDIKIKIHGLRDDITVENYQLYQKQIKFFENNSFVENDRLEKILKVLDLAYRTLKQ